VSVVGRSVIGMTGVSGAAAFHGDGEPPCPIEASAGRAARTRDVRTLDDGELLDAIAESERAIARADAAQLDLLAEFARRPARLDLVVADPALARSEDAPPGQWVREFADDEIAVKLRISRAAASVRIRLACSLVTLPATRAALGAGRIDVTRARVIAEETDALDSSARREVEGAVIGAAERLPAARLRPTVRREAHAADTVAAQARCNAARTERRVVITPTVDGMAELWALLPAVEAMAIGTAVSAAARTSRANAEPGDARTMDQRRADALAAPFLEALDTGELSGVRLAANRGRAAELQVTVAASTLLGADDRPAELRGYGVITAGTARALAPDSRWRRVLTDALSGAVLDVGTRTYRPPADLARHVQTRDQRCAFPGCGWTAEVCDLDHVVPFPGGRTSAANLRPLCRRHHRFKHSGAVRIELDEDGTTRWHLPGGQIHEVRPPPVGVTPDEPPRASDEGSGPSAEEDGPSTEEDGAQA
jgi:hypothetical protein